MDSKPYQLGVYTVARDYVHPLLDYPWYVNLDRLNASPYMPDEYVNALVRKRNTAVERLLAANPDTTHVMCCDSYYVGQIDALEQLISDSRQVPNAIIGGATWGIRRMRLKDIFWERLQWYDRWGVPELAGYKFSRHGHRTDLMRTLTVPGIHIFPRWLWDRGLRYERVGNSTEPAGLCLKARVLGVESYVDFKARFYREGMYSRMKCVKCSIGLRSRLGLHRTMPMEEPKGIIHR